MKAYFSASPNPVTTSVNGYGSTTLLWNAPSTSTIEIHFGSPSGAVETTGGPTGSFQTPPVSDGTAFYLQDANNGNSNSSSNTLAMLVVHVQQPPSTFFIAEPNPVSLTIAGFFTTLEWNAPTGSTVQIRVGAPDGVLFAEGGSSGAATTGNWLANGLLFYLQDVTGGKPLTPANTLAVAIVTLSY